MPRPTLHLLLAAAALTSGCSSKQPSPEAQDARTKPYVIGLGEIMGLTQMRHAKLWFAGKASNWPLAAYELDEIREGLDDAATFHPHHKSVPRPLGGMIAEFVGPPLDDLGAAVRAKDSGKFVAAFDRLTDGCNACHREAAFGFNVVTRPTSPPVSNQNFAPHS